MVTLNTYCCMFTYENRSEITCTALGLVYSWSNLCVEYNRIGPQCPTSNAVHFKTISTLGPKLFAVSIDTLKVFYHENSQWHQYESARNVRLGTLKELMRFFNNDDDNEDDDLSQKDNQGKDLDKSEYSRQVKDSHSTNDFQYQINQAILYHLLYQMMGPILLSFYIIQSQSFIH